MSVSDLGAPARDPDATESSVEAQCLPVEYCIRMIKEYRLILTYWW